MDYSQTPLAELKKIAKGRRIKMYYTKSIRELRWILTQPDLPMNYKIEKYTIKELREQAKEKTIRGFWNLSRSQLLSLLYPSNTSPTHEQYHRNDYPNEHCDPQTNDNKQVGV